MRTRLRVASIVVLLMAGRAFAASPGTEWTYQYALSTSDRGADLTHIAGSFEGRTLLGDVAMLDLFAETLIRGAQRKDYSQIVLIRMARVMQDLKSPRYTTAMNAVAQSAADRAGMRRDDREYREALEEIAREFVEKHGASPVEQYRPGSIDLDAMRTQFEAPRTGPAPTTALGRKVLTIRVGEDGATFDDVIGTLGTPTLMAIGTPVLANGGFSAGGVRWTTHTVVKYRGTNRLHYSYRGIGRITFAYTHATGWRAREAIADPMLVERAMPYRTDPAANGQPDEMTLRMHELLYGGYRSARQAIEVWAPVSFTPEVKDAAAEFLATNYAPSRGRIIDDTFVVLSRFLAQSDAVRYGALIQDIAARSADKRLRKIAESVIGASGDPARRYQPGAVSLESLCRKYPPLYPDSTFIGPENGAKEIDEPAAD